MTRSKILRVIQVSVHVALVAALAGCTESSEGFRLDQGIIVREFSGAGDLRRWSLAQHTTTISKQALVSQSDSERRGLGYIITAPPGVEYFEVHSVSRLPGIPGRIGGSLKENSSPEDALDGLKTSPQMFHKLGYEAFDLEEDDPFGEYQIDVFVDGEFIDTLVFEVKS